MSLHDRTHTPEQQGRHHGAGELCELVARVKREVLKITTAPASRAHTSSERGGMCSSSSWHRRAWCAPMEELDHEGGVDAATVEDRVEE
jgi:hypothetical protein